MAYEQGPMSMADTTSPAGIDQQLQSPADRAAPERSAVPRAAGKGKAPVWLLVVAFVIALGGGGAWYLWQQYLNALPLYIAATNGRLEAEQTQISTKYAGRIAVVLAKEGDMVHAGDVLARMDTDELNAQLRSAEAQVLKSEREEAMAEATITQSESERIFAAQQFLRTSTLVAKGWSTRELLDQRQSDLKVAQAKHDTAIANREASAAQIAANQAEVTRLQKQISDSTLVAPTGGRIQYKLAEPGEVLPAGGRVLTLLDLSDVYMTVFVPARVAGPLAVGDDARITLDPAPRYVFPAKVTFVATEAQFTPKTVETAEEREKLMFRLKLSIDPSVRVRHEERVKTGIRGIGYVRTKRDAAWPAQLAVKLP